MQNISKSSKISHSLVPPQSYLSHRIILARCNSLGKISLNSRLKMPGLVQFMREGRRWPSFIGVVGVLMMMVGKYSEGTDH